MLTATQVGPYERLMLVRAASFSSHPPAAALAALGQQAAERHLDAGTVLARANERWDTVHIVVDGRVGVYERGGRLYSAGPTEAFGLLETLARAGAGIEARAEVDTITLEIAATTLLSIFEDHFVMTLGAIQRLSRMLLATPSWLSETMTQPVRVPAIDPHGELDLVDRIRLLRTSDLFAHARTDSLAELAAQYEPFRAAPGTTLWHEGDEGGWFLVLLDGCIDSASAGGLRFSWCPGMIAGGVEALATAPRWHDATTTTSIIGLRLGAERLFDALEDDFSMAEDLLSTLAVRIRGRQLHANPPVSS